MQKMHWAILFVTAISLVVIGGLGVFWLASPSSPPPASAVNNTTLIHTGFRQVESNPVVNYLSLDDAVSAVAGIAKDANASRQNYPIYYIKGLHVNGSGYAEQWILGVREGRNITLKTCDRFGTGTIPWQGDKLPDQEIDLSGIRSPTEIMNIVSSGNQALFGDAELEISRGNYTVTGPAGSHPREYIVNASTGEVIATND